MECEVKTKHMKILISLNLYLCFFTMGMSMAVPGPCLLDLQSIVNTDTQHIAYIYTARFIGYLVGSVFGGIFLDYVKSKQTIMTVANCFMALSMLAVPLSRNLGSLIGFMVISGFSIGTVDTGGNVICLTLWGCDSGPFYQALHFTFGLGSLVAPLIAAPFLGNFNHNVSYAEENNATIYSFTADNFNSSTEYFNFNNSGPIDNTSKVIYPFLIIGGFGLIVTLMFLIACIISPTEQKISQNRNFKNNKIDLKFLLSVGFLNVLLLFVETGTEIGYAQMLTTYVVKGRLQLSSSVGSFMTSTFWAAFTLSRLVSIFLAIKVSSFTLIILDLVIILVGSLVLLFLASYEWAMWITSVLLGAGIASFFPAAIGWLNCYINVTNKIASIFIVGASLGGMVIPFTISYFMDTFPDVLIYVVPITTVSCALIVLILYFILRKREKKDAKKEPESFAFITSTVKT